MSLTDLQKSAVVALLVKECGTRKVFCGETLVQKSVFFLQELLGVPLDFKFRLYKYGPFSFDLQSHLAAMRADNLITVRPLGYGATFGTGEDFSLLEERLPRTITKYQAEVSSIVSRLGWVGVKELEPLATALFFTQEGPEMSVGARAEKIRDVKPHIGMDQAMRAVSTIDEWREKKEAVVS